MLLDIIVPHYNEPWEIVRPLVNMIHSQKCVDFNDFRVTIIHDGVDPFPDEYLEGPANIIQVCQEKQGVSAARNYGIDHSEAEWVNFSDCDDCYCSALALFYLFCVLKNNPPWNVIWSPFYMLEGQNLIPFTEYTPIFIHNKYYRRSFLNEHNIRFCNDVNFSEDSAFNAIVRMCLRKGETGKIEFKEPIYIWCRRVGSVTLNPDLFYNNVLGHFKHNVYIMEEAKRIKGPARYELMAYRTLSDAYARLSIREITNIPDDLKKMAVEFWLEHKDECPLVTEAEKKQIHKVSDFEAECTPEDISNRPGLEEWYDRLTMEVQKS